MSINPHSEAREAALQYLYQCEAEKIFYFSPSACDQYRDYFGVNLDARKYFETLCEGVLSNIAEIDELLGKHAKNWSVARMAATDRIVLRMATWELTQGKEPPKVVVNEAVELAKKYGTENSGSFVNGIIDSLMRANAKPS